MRKYFYLETKEIDNSKKWKGYLFFILLWLIGGRFVPKQNEIRDYYVIVMYAITIIGMVTYGYSDISSFLTRKYSIKKNIGIGIGIFLTSGAVSLIVRFLLKTTNPQNLVAGEMLTIDYLKEINLLLLLPFAEEFFKFMLLIFIYKVVTKFSANKQIGLWGSMLATCLIFGAMHMHYNYDKALVITLSLGLGTMVYLWVLMKYKCIIPLIIAHFLQDFGAFTRMWEHGQGIFNIINIFFVIFIIYMGIKDIRKA